MIHVVGLGLGDSTTLADDARKAIQTAQLIIGSQRQLSCVHALVCATQMQRYYPQPFKILSTQLLADLKKDATVNICLLASGDPLYYGVSNFLLRHFSAHQLHFYSNISSVQVAFARIKKPWQQAKVISLHGRPLTNLIPFLAHHSLIALLTDQQSHPQAIATLLCTAGYAEATLWVCEALGSINEKVRSFKAKQLLAATDIFHPLHITIIETPLALCTLPSFAGFNDELFITDTKQAGKGMITKREVRLVALSLMQPRVNDIAWDVGAGCGTIAVEWAYWNQQGTIYAVEYHPNRLTCLEQNKVKFGVNNLHIIAKKAPSGLGKLPRPHAVFIGGTAGMLTAIMDSCWGALINGGCLVINCVTEQCKVNLQQWLSQHAIENNQLEWTDIAVSKGGELAGQLVMRPRLPVRLLKIVKAS